MDLDPKSFNGKTWIIVGGLLVSTLSFFSGWVVKQETASAERATESQTVKDLIAWRKEHTDTTSTPGMERLRKAEVALERAEARLSHLEMAIGEVKMDIREIRSGLREGRKVP